MMDHKQSESPQLSILVPSIPSRKDAAFILYDKIMGMVGDNDIEVLLLMDNKKRTIGEKREALKNMSNGKYFMIVDDDDDLLSIDEIYRATFNDVDVITFKQKCFNSDGSSYIVTFGLDNEVEHNTNEDTGMYVDMKRPPFHVCAWNKKFKEFAYPPISFGEDWGFIEQALKVAKTEYYIDKIIHQYNFDPKVSEAPTSSQVSDGDIDSVSDKDEKVDNDILREKLPANIEGSREFNKANEADYKKEYAVVNLITSDIPRYTTGQLRLQESMIDFCPSHIDRFYFTGEEYVDSPKHAENPYAFKLYAIKKVREMGYKKILWVDASVVAVKDFTSVFDWIEEKGIFFEHSGWMAGRWTNDEALRKLNITREQANEMPMFSAGFCGFDFTNKISIDFFQAWWDAMQQGTFVGSWEDHRHDMSVGSIVAYRQNLTHLYSECTKFFSYIGPGYTPNPDSPFQLLGL